jgi:hypothetical protein
MIHPLILPANDKTAHGFLGPLRQIPLGAFCFPMKGRRSLSGLCWTGTTSNNDAWRAMNRKVGREKCRIFLLWALHKQGFLASTLAFRSRPCGLDRLEPGDSPLSRTFSPPLKKKTR